MHHYDDTFAIVPGAIGMHSELSPADKLVYGTMLALSNKTGICFASHDRIAARVHLARETVGRSISALKGHRMIRPYVDPSTGKPVFMKGGPRNGRTQAYECLYLLRKRKPKIVSMPDRKSSAL